MPYASATTPAQIRFRIAPEQTMAAIVTVSILFKDTPAASFMAPAVGTSGTAPGAVSTGEWGGLTSFDVRYDELRTVGRTTELFYSATNRTAEALVAHGDRLVFVGTGPDGQPVEAPARTYAVRGTADRPLTGVSVMPGATGRFRVVFPIVGVHGPVTIKDGQTTVTPPSPAVSEPVGEGSRPVGQKMRADLNCWWKR